MKRAGFSLVEVVIALGLFAFCIVVILGMMAVGLRTARSVADETVAVSITQSVLAGWKMQTNKTKALTITNFITNVPALSSGGSHTFYFNGEGVQVASANEASLKLDYKSEKQTIDLPDGTTPSGTIPVTNALITFDFQWPANAPADKAQKRQMQGAIHL